MSKKIIEGWKDAVTGTFTDGTRFRVAKANAPAIGEPGHKSMHRYAEELAPPDSEVDARVVGTDHRGRKIVIIRASGMNVGTALSLRGTVFED